MERNGCVRVSVHEQKRGIVRRYIVDRRCGPDSFVLSRVFLHWLIRGPSQKQCHCVGAIASAHLRKIDRRGASDYTLELGAFAVDWVRVVWVTRAIHSSKQADQMTAG